VSRRSSYKKALRLFSRSPELDKLAPKVALVAKIAMMRVNLFRTPVQQTLPANHAFPLEQTAPDAPTLPGLPRKKASHVETLAVTGVGCWGSRIDSRFDSTVDSVVPGRGSPLHAGNMAYSTAMRCS
jgi:hypothetical protein